MRLRLLTLALVAAVASPLASVQVLSWDPLKDIRQALPGGAPHDGSVIEARHQAREMANDALAALHEIQTNLRFAVERAAGDAVFSTFGIKLFFAGGTTGKGVAVNDHTGRQTFMKMVQVQSGLGFGVNKNRLVLIFTSNRALRNFIDQGWEFGA